MQKISDSSVGTQKQIGFQTIKQPDSARREKQKVADNREGYQQKGIIVRACYASNNCGVNTQRNAEGH